MRHMLAMYGFVELVELMDILLNLPKNKKNT